MSDFTFKKESGMENFLDFNINFKDVRHIYLNIPQFICLSYWDGHKEYIKFIDDNWARVAKDLLKNAYMNRNFKLVTCRLHLS